MLGKRIFIRVAFLSFTCIHMDLLGQNTDAGTLTQSLLQQVFQQNNTSGSTQNGIQNNGSTTSPEVPTVKEPLLSNNEQNKKNKDIKQKQIHLPGSIFITNEKYFSGLLYLDDFSLSVSSEYQQKDFIKNLSVKQMKNITCISWAGILQDEKNKMYLFTCSLYNIKDMDGYNYVYRKPIPALGQIMFKNNLGSTMFYSYFYDYETKDHRWQNLRLPISLKTVDHPISGVIRTIQLGDLDQKSLSALTPAQKLEISSDQHKTQNGNAVASLPMINSKKSEQSQNKSNSTPEVTKPNQQHIHQRMSQEKATNQTQPNHPIKPNSSVKKVEARKIKNPSKESEDAQKQIRSVR